MTSIYCLLRNTDLLEASKELMDAIMVHNFENGKTVGFRDIYNGIRSVGVDLDIESAAHLYKEMYGDKTDAGFDHPDTVDDEAVKEYRRNLRTLMLMKPKTGEMGTKSEMTVGKTIASALYNTFHNSMTDDLRTKNELRQMEDRVRELANSYAGELKKKGIDVDPKGYVDVLTKVIDQHDNMGLINNETGLPNRIADVYSDLLKLVDSATHDLGESDTVDDFTKAQFREYIKGLQDASMTLLHTKAEGRAIRDGALVDAGFGRINPKTGKPEVDYEALAGNIGDVKDLRSNVIQALQKRGFEASTAARVADSMASEFIEVKKRLFEKDWERSNKRMEVDQTAKPTAKPDIPIDKAVADRINEVIKHRSLHGDNDFSTNVSKKEAKRIMADLFEKAKLVKNLGLNGKGKPQLDIDKISEQIDNRDDIYDKIREVATDYINNDNRLKDLSDDEKREHIDSLSDSMKEVVDQQFEKVREFVQKRQDALENAWQPSTTKATPKTLADRLNRRIDDFISYKRKPGVRNAQLTLMPAESRSVIENALRTSQEYGKDTKAGGRVIDMDKMAQNMPDLATVKKVVAESLEPTMGKFRAQDIANTFNNKEAFDMFTKEYGDKIDKYVEAKQKGIEDAWNAAATPAKPVTLFEKLYKRIKDMDAYNMRPNVKPRELTLMPGESRATLAYALKESQQYGKDKPDGTRGLDWQKLAEDVPTKDALRDMVYQSLKGEIGDAEAKAIAGTLDDNKVYFQFIDDLHAHNEKVLQQRQNALGRMAPERKSDIHKLAELSALGVFGGQFDQLAYRVAGVAEGDVEAIARLKGMADTWLTMNQYSGFNTPAINNELHTLQKDMQAIVDISQKNRTKALRMASAFDKMMQLQNLSMIEGHKNLEENHLSGAIEVLTTMANYATTFGPAALKTNGQMLKLFRSTWWDIAGGGVEYGESTHAGLGGKRSVMELCRPSELKHLSPYHKLLALTTLTGRAFLSGTDGAVKAIIHRMQMIMAFDAVCRQKGMSKNESLQFLHNAFFGEKSIENARQKTEQMFRLIGIDPKDISKARMNRAVNDMLLMEVQSGLELDNETMHAVCSSSYKVAGMGMGHEANNVLSQRNSKWQSESNKKYEQFMANGEYAKAARQSIWNSVLHKGIMKFTSAQMNWAVLKVEQAGWGVLSGYYKAGRTSETWNPAKIWKMMNMYGGEMPVDFQRHTPDRADYKSELDYMEALKNSKRLHQKEISEKLASMMDAKQKVFRGIVGMTLSAAIQGGVSAIAGLIYPEDKDRDGEAVRHFYRDAKANPEWGSMILKLGTLPMQYSYLRAQMPATTPDQAQRWGEDPNKINPSATWYTAMKLTSQTFNFADDHSLPIVAGEIMDCYKSGSPKRREQALGIAGRWAGGMFPLPFVHALHDAYQFVKFMKTGSEPTHERPYGILRGVALGAGFMDLPGTGYNPPIEVLPGLSAKQIEFFHQSGIYNAMDIKDKGGLPTILEDINEKIRDYNIDRKQDQLSVDKEITEKSIKDGLAQYEHDAQYYERPIWGR